MVERKYYTPAEAAQSIGISEADIIHFIETNQLPAHIYSSRRAYIVITGGEDGSLIARGTVTFSGLLSVHQSWIQSLLEKGHIILDKWGKLTCTNELDHYSPENPLKRGLLPNNIKAWRSGTWEEICNNSPMLMPLPMEAPNAWHGIDNLLKGIQKAQGADETGISKKMDIPEFKLDFSQNGKFAKSDIRVTVEAVNKLLQGPSSMQTEQLSDSSELALHWCESKIRHTQIDRLVERLYLLNKSLKAPAMWSLLMEDYEADEPTYDLNSIVISIDSRSLDWENLKGETSRLSYKSFMNRLAVLRKFYST